jgi:hypothetical protein
MARIDMILYLLDDDGAVVDVAVLWLDDDGEWVRWPE